MIVEHLPAESRRARSSSWAYPEAMSATDEPQHLTERPDRDAHPVKDEDLPVVARMVVEIRSDGTRTVARGALEDAIQGEKVALEASGGSPAELAATLLKSVVKLPFEASPVARLRKVVKGLLPGK